MSSTTTSTSGATGSSSQRCAPRVTECSRSARSLVAVAGVQRLTNLYYGRHFYVYDLSVTEGARSKGHGERLLRHVEGVAREEGFGYVALACGRERDAALRFYEDCMGYERPGYSMRKALTQ